jgi:hypothetical protein
LDRFDPEFARDPRNVRLGLSTDGFTPYSTSATSYSCWPVFIMPYNLPPDKCLKEGFIFLALVIPGPKHPGKNINLFMRPLIEELKELWQGVKAYDSHLKCEFTLRAAYLWSIHDLLAYGIWAGWCVHGRLCPDVVGTSSWRTSAYAFSSSPRPGTNGILGTDAMGTSWRTSSALRSVHGTITLLAGTTGLSKNFGTNVVPSLPPLTS